MRFLCRVAGLALRYRMRSSTMPSEQKSAAPHNREDKLRWFWRLTRTPRSALCRAVSGTPAWTETQDQTQDLLDKLIPQSWLRNVWGSLRRGWNLWPWIENERIFSACFYCDTLQEKCQAWFCSRSGTLKSLYS